MTLKNPKKHPTNIEPKKRFSGGQVCPPHLSGVYDQMVAKLGRDGESQSLVIVNGKPIIFASVPTRGIDQLIAGVGGTYIGSIICLR